MSNDTPLKENIDIADHRRLSDTMFNTNLHATDYSKLVNVDGKLGLFTPLTDQDSSDTSNENLEQIIQVLRDKVASLQNQNQKLQQTLSEMTKASRRTPDDFATAISHSVDSLQARLHDTKNPVSRFAMREFKIETNVHVNVTPLGTVEYRFLQPEEEVDPTRLSKIEMSLVPLPKEENGWNPADFSHFTDIEEIQGIGERYQRKLNQHNIYSINDLLTAGTRVRSRVELASLLGVDRNKLSIWINLAELMTIKLIDGRKAEVLQLIGIDNLEQLAKQEAEALTNAFNTQVAEMNHATLKPVEQEEVLRWIKAADVYVSKNSRS